MDKYNTVILIIWCWESYNRTLVALFLSFAYELLLEVRGNALVICTRERNKRERVNDPKHVWLNLNIKITMEANYT